MPYEWSDTDAETPAEMRLRLWPHRSMTNRGFSLFIGITFVLICLPMIAVLGSPVMWALLPFAMGTLGLTMWMIRWKDTELKLIEELVLCDRHVQLVRREARGREHRWEANPHWVQVALHEDSGPVPNYVTLRGGDREVEIGAFLSPEERVDLYEDLKRHLGSGLSASTPRP